MADSKQHTSKDKNSPSDLPREAKNFQLLLDEIKKLKVGNEAEQKLLRIKQLLQDDTVPNLAHPDQKLALHTAIMLLGSEGKQYAVEVVGLLLNKGADPNVIDERGAKALDIAAMALNTSGSEQAITVIKLLIKDGPNLKSADSKTALEIATWILQSSNAEHAAKVIMR